MTPTFRKKLWNGWMKFGHVIGTFNTRLILSVIYFVIIAFYAIPRIVVRLFTWKKEIPSWNKKKIIIEPRAHLDRQF